MKSWKNVLTLRLLIPMGTGLLASLLNAPYASAAVVNIGTASTSYVCAATGICPSVGGSGFGIVKAFILTGVIPGLRTLFTAVAFAYFFYYALRLIVQGGEESTLTEGRTSFAHAAVGLALVGVSGFIADAFTSTTAASAIINPLPLETAVGRIKDYIILCTGGFMVFVMSMAGFRIIALQGNESEVEKQKKNFFYGLLGVLLIIMADRIVDAIRPDTALGPQDLVTDVGSIISFLLEIVAGLAVLSMLASGFYFIISLHSDERKQRARRIMTSTIVVLIVVMSAYTIVSLFI